MAANETKNPGNTPLAMLEAQVSVARVILLRRRRRMILERAARTATDFSLPLAVLGAVVILCDAMGWMGQRPAWILFACSLLVGIGIILRGLWNCWNANVSLMDAAERMDLASGSKNRLATAIEFGMEGRTDGLSTLAICDAIHHVQKSEAIKPLLPVNPPSARFKYELAGLLLCALTLGLGLRLGARATGSPHPTMAAVSRDAILRPGEVDSHASESTFHADDLRSNATSAKLSADQTNSRSDGPSNSASASAQLPTSSSAAGAAGSAQSNAGAQGGASGQSVASATDVTGHPNTAPMPQLADEGSDSSQGASPGKAAVASGSASDTKNPPTAVDQPDLQTQGNNQQPSGNSKQQNQNGGNSSGQKGDTKSTGINGQGAENTESTGGGGSGSGQSGSKKSRGVGTGLLGVRTPDFFKGQELPGPEQQNAMPAAPNPSNQIPALPSAAKPRQDDESSSDMTHTTADEAGMANAYFSRLRAR